MKGGRKPPLGELSLAWRRLREYRPDLEVLGTTGEEATPEAVAAARRYARVGTLDLSHNLLRGSCAFLSAFPALETLVLDSNRYTSATAFPPHARLRTLSLNNNRIAGLPAIVAAAAAAFPALAHLSLLGNPACPNYLTGGTAREYAAYRAFVAGALPALRTLDDSPVTPAERAEGRRVYGALAPCVPAGLSARAADQNVRQQSALRPPRPPTVRRGTVHTRRGTTVRSADGAGDGESVAGAGAGGEDSDSDWTSGEEL